MAVDEQATLVQLLDAIGQAGDYIGEPQPFPFDADERRSVSISKDGGPRRVCTQGPHHRVTWEEYESALGEKVSVENRYDISQSRGYRTILLQAPKVAAELMRIFRKTRPADRKSYKRRSESCAIVSSIADDSFGPEYAAELLEPDVLSSPNRLSELGASGTLQQVLNGLSRAAPGMYAVEPLINGLDYIADLQDRISSEYDDAFYTLRSALGDHTGWYLLVEGEALKADFPLMIGRISHCRKVADAWKEWYVRWKGESWLKTALIGFGEQGHKVLDRGEGNVDSHALIRATKDTVRPWLISTAWYCLDALTEGKFGLRTKPTLNGEDFQRCEFRPMRSWQFHVERWMQATEELRRNVPRLLPLRHG
ncbi:MAG: hypothetical protein ABSA67_07365 [Candidatus Brocadiia bacterium]|jgi:hypothetical protein